MSQKLIKIYPDNVEVQVEENTTIKDVLNEAGIDFDFPCGGVGKCKKCQVRIISNDKESDVLALACQYQIKSDLIVDISRKEQKYSILNEGVNREIVFEPLVNKVFLDLSNPTLEDSRPDWTRIKQALGTNQVKANVRFYQSLPNKIRNAEFKTTVVIEAEEVVEAEPGDTTDNLLGMAFDIGTTSVVGYLLDLNTGKELAHVSNLNPQTKYGADVITRITFAAQQEDGLFKLHRDIIKEINNLISKATHQAGYSPEDVYAATVAGNTTMHHLFLKIQPDNLAQSPYVPVVKDALIVDAEDLNINMNPAGKIFVLPNIAGFVGADTVAASLAADMDKGDKLRLLIDIGTNGEMVLGNQNRLVACSTAAGPAFEGAQIACGMRGAEGAIDHISIGEDYQYSVIGDVLPQGICGSGLLDVAAELLEIGIIDATGRLLSPEKITHEIGQKYKDRSVEIDGIRAFLLAENTETGQKVYINQKDIRELQLAKGAIAAGIEILIESFGAKVEDIDEILLAGAFGNYLDPYSACRIGLIPAQLEHKIKGIGNAAGAGAKFALLSSREYQRGIEISQKVEYIELSSQRTFTPIFAKKLKF